MGGNFQEDVLTLARANYAMAASKVLPPGSFNVGLCVRNVGSAVISNNNSMNGFVQVTT